MFDPTLHLFVDDYHIRNLFALQRVYGVPEKHPTPVLSDIPGRVVGWGSVIHEPGSDGSQRFRLWYQSVCDSSVHEMSSAGLYGRGEEFGFFPERFPQPVRESQTSVISYAESRDGIHWEKPDLGLVEWQDSTANNIVLDGAGAARQFDGALTNMDTVSVLRDEADPDPQRRYKMICHWETVHVWDNRVSTLGRSEGYMKRIWAARAKYLTTSPDGIHWEAPLVRIKECAGGGDYAGVTRDERNKRYWFSDRAPIGLSGIRYRSAAFCTSPDLYHWPETVEMAFAPGVYEDYGKRYEHHGMVPFNYGDQDLCFLEYSITGRPVAGVLGSHRDGERWRLVNGNHHFLPLGPTGAFDSEIVAMTRNAPVRSGDRLLFFYNGRASASYDPLVQIEGKGYLGVATLRLDGFAGLTVDELAERRHQLPAMLLTQPITVQRNELLINLADHHGTAKVALLDLAAQPIPGYELENCLPLAEGVRVPVRWQEQATVSALAGQPVLVLVQMQAGTLYALCL